MDTLKEEKRVLWLTYLLIATIFVNVAFISPTFDKGAVIMGVILCGLLAYSHFIIRKFFPDGDKYILIFSNILAVIGLAMLYRLDLPVSGGTYVTDEARTFLATKQIIFFTLGVAAFILVVVILPDLKSFSKYKYFYLVVTLVFMAMGSLLGKETFGAKNWVSIAGFSFQPSEFGKVALVAYLASALKDYGNPSNLSKKLGGKIFKDNPKFNNVISLIEPAIVVMISLAFMLLQTDLGSALIFFSISLTMLYIATSKGKYVVIALVLFIVGAVAGYFLFGHVRTRVMIWQDPWKYGYDAGLQLVQSLIAIANGGFFGKGLGMGYPGFIPVIESDFIFSGICEELGLLTGLAIIILYFLIFYRCIRAAIYAKDNFSRLLAVGYSTMIVSQVLVIIGGVTGAIPLTGITLPLVSYGGSSVLITYISLGIIQKISEEGNSYE
ncbi:FtsW/RodA/SpoVE family cell cycle protein [Clostridium sp. UBA4548]|uniref:FtsW/RodA/SpoVE family cell cycle protein n=1 Tax=Clostridium sp. UBA4548 TaxID=1946361 RepID=UPI0025BA2A09|nr:FtsW/RodA/SpoVE family cell cycle protein [Clostridium sp. UBA4548]